MAKGYVISRVDIKNPEAYAEYVRLGTEVIRKFGGKPIVRGGKHEAMEGAARARNVVIEFDDYATALAYYRSADYQAAKAKRAGAADMEIVVVEGV